VQAPTQAAPTPPIKVQQPATKPAPSGLEQREARLRAQMEAKKTKRQGRRGVTFDACAGAALIHD
jgi:hypothetical protein